MVLTGVTEIGEGILTVLSQITAEVLGMYPENVTIGDNDTARSPEAAHAGASRQTYMIGNAVYNACLDVKAKFLRVIADYWNVDVQCIQMRNRRVYVEGHSRFNLPLEDAVDVCKKIRGVVPGRLRNLYGTS